jgi:hypothetical protein
MQGEHLPTHLLYAAAERPPVEGVMTADAFAAARRKPATYPPGGHCYLCGAALGDAAFPTSARFKDEDWTAHGLAACAASEWLCEACAYSLQEKISRPDLWPKPFRMRCQTQYVAGDRWTVMGLSDKARMAAILLDPPAAPWLLCMTDSPLSASHTLFRTPVNRPGASGWGVMLGNVLVIGDAQTLRMLLDAVEALYAAGHGKNAISTGDYRTKWINAQGVESWATLEAAIAPWRGRPLFDLAVFLAQKEQGNEQPES